MEGIIMKIIKKRPLQGMCPKCKECHLNYFSMELQDESVNWPYKCNDCGFEGTEWFLLQFGYHMDKEGNIY